MEEVDIPSSRDMGDIFASTLSIADTEVSSYLTHQPRAGPTSSDLRT